MLRTAHTQRRKSITALLLFAFVCLPVSGAANHYCFDGLEAPVSYHFDNFSGHDDHEGESGQHLDLEKPVLDDNLVSKNTQSFDHVLLDTSIILVASKSFSPFVAVARSSTISTSSIWYLRSPLRAPPQIS